jgi:hypothetical protein
MNSGQPIINPLTSKRFEEKCIYLIEETNLTPGVGNYNVNI